MDVDKKKRTGEAGSEASIELKDVGGECLKDPTYGFVFMRSLLFSMAEGR